MRAAVVSLAFTCLFSTAYAECIPGKYAGTGGEEGQDPFPILIAVTCEGDVVGGLIETVFGNATVTGGETSADRWRLEATFDSAPLRLEAARNGEAWTGHYDLAGQTGALNLRRDDAATFAALSAQQEARLDLAVGQWREDLAFLAREIPARHANAFHTIDRQPWAHAVSQVDARLPSLNGAQTAVALRELVARIGDGHTSVQGRPLDACRCASSGSAVNCASSKRRLIAPISSARAFYALAAAASGTRRAPRPDFWRARTAGRTCR